MVVNTLAVYFDMIVVPDYNFRSEGRRRENVSKTIPPLEEVITKYGMSVIIFDTTITTNKENSTVIL